MSMFLLVSCTTPLKGITPPQRIGVWFVYWDGERGLAELERYGGLFNRVSFFAYELDVEAHPQPAPGFAGFLPHFFTFAKKHGFEPWVTVVNDVRAGENKVLLKNVDVLRRILAEPERRKAHAASLAEKVLLDGFAGLDLDYEGLDGSDQDNFRDLVSELSVELQRRSLRLNVVLEPQRGPLPSPGTASVTIMGYNLHGTHSGPGPRATPDFVAKLGERGRGDAKGSPDLALALAGFSWSPGKKAKQVDWAETQKLAANSAKAGRDALTRVPYAHLEDGTEIWFEDPESLHAKWDAAQQAGFSGLMLWRLGGNNDSLFQLLHNYRSGTTPR